MAMLSGCSLLWFLWGWWGAWLPGNERGSKTKGAGVRERFGAGVSVCGVRWGGDTERTRERAWQTQWTGQRKTEGETEAETETDRQREGGAEKGKAERDTAHRKRLREAEIVKLGKTPETHRDRHREMGRNRGIFIHPRVPAACEYLQCVGPCALWR